MLTLFYDTLVRTNLLSSKKARMLYKENTHKKAHITKIN